MAILDKSKNNFVIDRDESKFIGLKLPLVLDNGEIASTRTTMEAVKQNVLNLCSTDRGEILMQPNLGIAIKKYLFEQFDENLVIQIQNTIADTMEYWMPFVKINDITVNMSDIEPNTMNISVNFSLEKDPNTQESVQITVGE